MIAGSILVVDVLNVVNVLKHTAQVVGDEGDTEDRETNTPTSPTLDDSDRCAMEEGTTDDSDDENDGPRICYIQGLMYS